jgi:hypothetical protein
LGKGRGEGKKLAMQEVIAKALFSTAILDGLAKSQKSLSFRATARILSL